MEPKRNEMKKTKKYITQTHTQNEYLGNTSGNIQGVYIIILYNLFVPFSPSLSTSTSRYVHIPTNNR
ncbi:hypothetical protein BLA29_013648 [Euroglyphus maynei]|uniref:Uncharacterized protein n=1 Tax=Euroglyphus maynei TaxID=6958 RepID=A0A1Y3B6J1_EURMA|nr:hypothetical protein BLA29_013648 [Euroglyphus maynei]